MTDKLKLLYYWNAGCGGCEVAFLDINEKILDAAAVGEFVFWPIMMDAKVTDVEALEDGSVDVAFLSGAIRNRENAHMARLVRQKSKIVVSFGACSNWGGIPGLANFTTRDAVLERVYDTSESTVNPRKTRPVWANAKGHPANPDNLTVPEMYRSLYPVTSVIPVDYLIPGCPPPADVIWNFIAELISDNPPSPGIYPNLPSTVCKTCPREKRDVRPKAFYRPHEIEADPDWCLMEQGIPCLGSATRDGCGALCTSAGMPCRGCFGPADGVLDQGAKFLSSVAAMVDTTDLKQIERRMAELDDIAATAYRFTLAASLLARSQVEEAKEQESTGYAEEVAGT